LLLVGVSHMETEHHQHETHDYLQAMDQRKTLGLLLSSHRT